MAKKAPSAPRISWQVEEYTHREKGPDWFWALGVIALAAAAIAVIYHDVLFAIFIVLSAIILGTYAARLPNVVDIAISDEGIKIKNYLYPFEKLKGFAVDEHDLGNHLLIESDRLLTPVISIPLPATIDTDGIIGLLRTKLKEKKLKEPESHRIMEHMGF